MIRLALLLLLVSTTTAVGQSATAQGFDAALARQTYAAALAFMQPRTLEPVPVPRLTGWGLHGLTALDPTLVVDATESVIRLSLGQRPLREATPPDADDIDAWAALAADLATSAWPYSTALRRAGTTGVVTAFFDEVFNHLDPYSRYEPPAAAEIDRDKRNGQAGAGITLGMRGERVVVAAVAQDGPAADAGLHVGDTILSVDDDPVGGRDSAAIAALIAGPEDTDVTIAWRGRDGRPRSAQITRALVSPESVFASRLGRLLLLRVTGFNRSTETHVAAELGRALNAPRPPDGLILDMRGNRGGIVRQAVDLAGLLIEGGVVAYTVGRDPAATRTWKAASAELAGTLPVVILVDGRTASAAEIVAAALADHGRAIVVGSETLGKGLVQTIATLPDNGELFVTWSRVLAPALWPIQGLGVMPQVCTSTGEAALADELHALEAGRAPMRVALSRHHAARAPLPAAQVVAIRDPCPAAEGGDRDVTTAQWLIAHPAAYAAALLPPLPAGP